MNDDIICLISPLPKLGRDSLKPTGYGYIQTQPPCVDLPSLNLPLNEYTKEMARRYLQVPSKRVIGFSKEVTPCSRVRILLGCHTSVVFDMAEQGWTDEVNPCPEVKRGVLMRGRGRPWKIITGYVVTDLYTEKTAFHVEETLVLVGQVTDAEVEDYIHREETGYAVGGLYLNGRGALFTRCIEGSFFNALGCSPHVVKNLLKGLGCHDICHTK